MQTLFHSLVGCSSHRGVSSKRYAGNSILHTYKDLNPKITSSLCEQKDALKNLLKYPMKTKINKTSLIKKGRKKYKLNRAFPCVSYYLMHRTEFFSSVQYCVSRLNSSGIII